MWMHRKRLPRHGRVILRLVLELNDAQSTTAADLARRVVRMEEKLTTLPESHDAPA